MLVTNIENKKSASKWLFFGARTSIKVIYTYCKCTYLRGQKCEQNMANFRTPQLNKSVFFTWRTFFIIFYTQVSTGLQANYFSVTLVTIMQKDTVISPCKASILKTQRFQLNLVDSKKLLCIIMRIKCRALRDEKS